MIIEKRMEVYLESLNMGNGAFLDELEAYARENRIPVIRPGMQSLLKVLLAASKPKRILEVGTAVGFSALLMASVTDPDCGLLRLKIMKIGFRRPGNSLPGPGWRNGLPFLPETRGNCLPAMEDSFDFIFMDAAKGQYIHFLKDALRLLKTGGLLVSD